MTHPLFFAALVLIGLVSAVYFLWSSLEVAFRGADAAVLPAARADSRRTLEARKNTVLSNLKDLQFDHAAGKLSEEDFEPLEKKLRAEARRVLRLLDEDVKPFRALAEARLAAHLEGLGHEGERQAASEPPDEPTSEAVKPDVRTACAACGTDNEADAVFCKKCGEPIDTSSTATENDDDGESDVSVEEADS